MKMKEDGVIKYVINYTVNYYRGNKSVAGLHPTLISLDYGKR